MDSLQKKLVCILAVLTAVCATIAGCLFHSIYIAPDHVQVHSMTLKSEKIPASMQDVSIVYFTDLEFGTFETEARAKALFSKIKALNPSVLLFGGDLFDAKAKASPKEAEQVTELFNEIKAPLGKFAVLGEMDVQSDRRLETVRNVYQAAQVEVLDNSNVKLANQSSEGIGLAGISTQPDWSQAFIGLNGKQYNLVLSHFADPLQASLQAYPISQVLVGNSHGTQVNWPVFGGYTKWKGSTKINRAEEPKLDFPYYISSGTGCTHVDARFNAPVEVVYILLSSR